MLKVTYLLDGNDYMHQSVGLYDSIPNSWKSNKTVDISQRKQKYPTFARIISIELV